MGLFDISCPSCGDKTQVALENGAEPVRIKPGTRLHGTPSPGATAFRCANSDECGDYVYVFYE